MPLLKTRHQSLTKVWGGGEVGEKGGGLDIPVHGYKNRRQKFLYFL